MKFKQKYRSVNIKVILLLAVYIFVSLTNLYFVERHTRNFNSNYKNSFITKRKAKNMFRMQKAASTTFSQNQTQYKQISQKVALFFIVLLFAPGLFILKKNLFPHSNQLIPDYQYAFLRHRSIQIWYSFYLTTAFSRQFSKYWAELNSTLMPLSMLLNHQEKQE